nr:unnamed protein product [Digitaria exilis]
MASAGTLPDIFLQAAYPGARVLAPPPPTSSSPKRGPIFIPPPFVVLPDPVTPGATPCLGASTLLSVGGGPPSPMPPLPGAPSPASVAHLQARRALLRAERALPSPARPCPDLQARRHPGPDFFFLTWSTDAISSPTSPLMPIREHEQDFPSSFLLVPICEHTRLRQRGRGQLRHVRLRRRARVAAAASTHGCKSPACAWRESPACLGSPAS